MYDECGLRYVAIHRNPETLAHIQANSSSLAAKKKRTRRGGTVRGEETISPRDLLLAYKKRYLVERVRTAEQRLLEMQQQLAMQVEASIQREANIAELEPCRSFVEHMRMQMLREKLRRFEDLPE